MPPTTVPAASSENTYPTAASEAKCSSTDAGRIKRITDVANIAQSVVQPMTANNGALPALN
ncbi:hypothetical protein D9M71_726440 [compost metagenome]